ncbi:MAG: hypothetical protein ACK5PZ_01920 [Pirellula sp.]
MSRTALTAGSVAPTSHHRIAAHQSSKAYRIAYSLFLIPDALSL